MICCRCQRKRAIGHIRKRSITRIFTYIPACHLEAFFLFDILILTMQTRFAHDWHRAGHVISPVSRIWYDIL